MCSPVGRNGFSKQTASIGEIIPGRRFELKIQAKSTEEFSELRTLQLSCMNKLKEK